MEVLIFLCFLFGVLTIAAIGDYITRKIELRKRQAYLREVRKYLR